VLGQGVCDLVSKSQLLISMKRSIEPIQAGSMADIAFLLLLFFLVSTTIATEQGLRSDLPPESDLEGPTSQQNALEIKMNKHGELMIEGEISNFDKLTSTVREYYLSSGLLTARTPNDGMPNRKWIEQSRCLTEIQKLSNSGNETVQLKKWQARLATINLLGPYRELPRSACIMLSTDGGASYTDYMKLQNAIKKEVNELRDTFCQQHLKRSYHDLDKKFGPDIEILNALQLAFPSLVVDISEV